MFHDRARIHVVAGRGGDGGLSFRREKHVPKGGPDGGDGGRGGDVVVVANPALRDLSGFRARRWFQAGRGEPGRAPASTAPTAPPSSWRFRSARRCSAPRAIWSPTSPGRERASCVARGGRGGRGNAHFATPTRQTPRFSEVGEPPEEADVELRLKLVADAALAGLPNAGKSSLLRRISNAKPKVADYPFTTLEPVLGTVESPDGTQLTVADVPGLIEGASEGIGLGHEFLAHLERARLLLHVIDASEGDSEQRFRTIDAELALYGAGLDERPQARRPEQGRPPAEPPSFELDDPRIVAVHARLGRDRSGHRGAQARALRALPGRAEPEAPTDRRTTSPTSSSTGRSRGSAARIASTEPTAATGSPATRQAARHWRKRSRLRESGKARRSRSATRASSWDS